MSFSQQALVQLPIKQETVIALIKQIDELKQCITILEKVDNKRSAHINIEKNADLETLVKTSEEKLKQLKKSRENDDAEIQNLTETNRQNYIRASLHSNVITSNNNELQACAFKQNLRINNLTTIIVAKNSLLEAADRKIQAMQTRMTELEEALMEAHRLNQLLTNQVATINYSSPTPLAANSFFFRTPAQPALAATNSQTNNMPTINLNNPQPNTPSLN